MPEHPLCQTLRQILADLQAQKAAIELTIQATLNALNELNCIIPGNGGAE